MLENQNFQNIENYIYKNLHNTKIDISQINYKFDINKFFITYINKIDIYRYKEINKLLNAINRSNDIINNQSIKYANYSYRASTGPNNCIQIIESNKMKITDYWKKIFDYILYDKDLHTSFLNFLTNELNKMSLNIDKFIQELTNNQIKLSNENIDLNLLENNLKNKLLEFNSNLKESNFFKFKSNHFWLICYIKIIINSEVKKNFKTYKLIQKSIINFNIKKEKNYEKINQNLKKINEIKNEIKINKESKNIIDKNILINMRQIQILNNSIIKNEYVYVIANEDFNKENIYKIGKTKNPLKRLNNLSTAHYGDFKFVKLFKCFNMTKVEIFLHEYFDDKRIKSNREFFQLEKKEIEKINSILKIKFENKIEEIAI